MSHVRDVDTAEFNQQVIERSSEVPVVVDFWAEWCQPCRTLGPSLERLTNAADGAFELAKVDVDQNQALAAQMGVQGIPTVVAFKDGQEVDRFTGALPEPQVEKWLAGFVPNPLDEFVAVANGLVNEGREEEAAAMYLKVLEADGQHEGAAVALASLKLLDGDTEAALEILEPLPSSVGVDRLRAAARLGTPGAISVEDLEAKLAGDPENETVQVDLARARIAGHQYEQGLDLLLEVITRKGDLMDDARTAVLDVFEVLGADNPLTIEYRRRLANALF
ncbi:MAG: thioredoxin [Acidimicrobiia bacterium]|nr:thioredoxin [Acidimicrobiia bacterium]